VVAKSLFDFLLENSPESIEIFPSHWLGQEAPIRSIQLFISIVLLVICVSGNITQLVVLAAYAR
jgi:hypothetical protein